MVDIARISINHIMFTNAMKKPCCIWVYLLLLGTAVAGIKTVEGPLRIFCFPVNWECPRGMVSFKGYCFLSCDTGYTIGEKYNEAWCMRPCPPDAMAFWGMCILKTGETLQLDYKPLCH